MVGVGGGSLSKPATDNSLRASERRRPALPHPKSPHTPTYTDGNRKTDSLVLGQTTAATFPTNPHCESYTFWQEVQPQFRPFQASPPALPLHWAPGPFQSHSPICPVHASRESPCCQAQALILKILCQVWSLAALQSQASPCSIFITCLN